MEQHMINAFKNTAISVLNEAEKNGCTTIKEAQIYIMNDKVNASSLNVSSNVSSNGNEKKKGKPNKPKEERNPSPHSKALGEGMKIMKKYFNDTKKYAHKHFLGAGHNIARWTLNGNDKYSEEVIIAVASKLYNENQQQMYEETNGEKGSKDAIFDSETVNQDIFEDKSKKSLEEIITVMKTKKTASKKTPAKKTPEKKTPEKKSTNKGKGKIIENPVYSEDEEETNQSSDSEESCDSDSEKSAEQSSSGSKKKMEYSDDSEEEKKDSDDSEESSDEEDEK